MSGTANLFTEEFMHSLKNFIAKRIANPHDAEDVLQEIFCRTCRHINTLKEAGKAQTWAFQIARNTINDYYRTRRVAEPLEETSDRATIEPEENGNKEIAGCLPAMVGHLSEKDRLALVLTEYLGLTQKEAAEILGLSLSGTKSRVQRAKRKLKKLLSDCCSLEFDRSGNIVDYKQKEKTNPFCNLS
ncbi:MAG: RNA polymerase sigma factor SigZ [Sporomusaceae bacterium]|nr:RNA polymerase sigma factor SigZ [Sporomusaceae bacterium]